MKESDLEITEDTSTEDTEKSKLTPRMKSTLKAMSTLKSSRREDDPNQQNKSENDESPPKSQRTHSVERAELDPYFLALRQFDDIKATVSAKLNNYFNHVKKNLVHSKHILAETFHDLIPTLSLKSFILCTLWLQTPYDEGEFKATLEFALYTLAHLSFEDIDASNSMSDDEHNARDTYKVDEESPYDVFVRTYPDPDTRNAILLSKLNTRFPEILSGDIIKERMLNELIYRSALPKSSSLPSVEEIDQQNSQEEQIPLVEKDYSHEIEVLRSDKTLLAWEAKMKTLAHLSEFIKRCVLDKTYKAALAASSNTAAKFFASKIKKLGIKVNNTLEVTKKNLELSLDFMRLLTSDLPEDDFQLALNDFLLKIEEDEHVANGDLIQIYNRYLNDIRTDDSALTPN